MNIAIVVAQGFFWGQYLGYFRLPTRKVSDSLVEITGTPSPKTIETIMEARREEIRNVQEIVDRELRYRAILDLSKKRYIEYVQSPNT